MTKARPCVIPDAYLEIRLPGVDETAFAGTVPRVEVRTQPTRTLPEWSLTVTFQGNDSEGTVDELLWSVFNADRPASFNLHVNGNTRYEGRILLLKYRPAARSLYRTITFHVSGGVHVV